MNKEEWFTEVCEESGSAFSLQIKERLHSEETPFQKIDIYATRAWGNLMVIDGFTMLSSRDNFLYHEMMSHPALYTHPAPEQVVIVGGGDCGTLREVLKHDDVRRCVQVEIDERVTRLSERYFPELCTANHDTRAEFFFGDGIEWMRQVAAASVDVIIVDSTDPVGPAKGLFGESFYRSCFNALGADGVLVHQSESPMIHMNIIEPMYGAMWDAGFRDVVTLNFPQPIYPTGWWSATLACKGTAGSEFRERDARDRAFDTRYYNADIHRAALTAPQFFRDAIAALRAERG